MIDSEFKIQSKDIDLIVYDFDGVMTDNRVIVAQDGTESVIVNRSDGLGVDYFRGLGIPQLILTTEKNPVVEVRAKKLRLEVISLCKDKRDAVENYCSKKGFNLSRVIYVGNDLNDLEAMKVVGVPVAPQDANVEIKKIAKLITESKGGEGVVKELYDYMSKCMEESQ